MAGWTGWRLGMAAPLVGLALVGSACSGGEDAPDPSASDGTPEATESGPAADPVGLPDACSLLTQQEIADATGLPFGPGEVGEQLSNDRQHVCDWISDDPFATAQVLVGDFGENFESQKASTSEVYEVIDVDLADAAYRTSEGSLFAMKVGDHFLQVSYIPNDPGEVTEITQVLAEKALARLQAS